MKNCGLRVIGTLEQLSSYDLDTKNLVNGKILYYFINAVNLGPYNFLDAGQLILVNCNDSIISNLNISYSAIPISLHYCYNNTISENTLNDNSYGITLNNCNHNTISRNTANNNSMGIELSNSKYNSILGNTANNNSHGIFLSWCEYNTISGNSACNNSIGIYLYRCEHNIISGNILKGNEECIKERFCYGNEFSDNGDCIYGQVKSSQTIPGYNLFFFFGIMFIVLFLIRKKVKKS